MSLSSTLRRAAAPAALAVMTAFAAANDAYASPPNLGDCAPAETVKAELVKSGYNNYFVYDVELLSKDSPKPVWIRESIYAKDGLKEGLYVGRGGKNNELMCVHAKVEDIVLGDATAQSKSRAIDPRFLQTLPDADAKDGINTVLKNSRKNGGQFPAIQALLTQKDGGKGYFTIALNPNNHKGGLLFSSLSGRFNDSREGLLAGAEPYTGYTPVALSVLEQMRKAEAQNNTPIRTASLK